MTQPQLEANSKIEQNGTKISDKEKVLNLIKSKPRTLNEISKILSKPKSTISARSTALVDEGKIRPIGERFENDNNQTLYGFVPINEQSMYSDMVLEQKFNDWKKRGLNKFSDLISPDLKYLLGL